MHYGAHSRHNTIHSSVWVHLARRCGGQGLLPRIRRLEAYNLSLSDVGPVTLLLSSSIRKLIVNFLGFAPEDGKDLDPDLPLIAAALFHDIVKTTAPHLTDLSLWDSFPLSPSHSALLGQCHNLRHLSVEGEAIKFNADAIRALERLDSLKFAHMVIRLDDCQTAVDLRLQTGFPALKSLILDGSAPDVANFIIAARLVALKSVDVTLVDSTDMSAVKGCLTQIAAHLPRRLRSFRFTITSISPGSPAATLRELLDPLYSLNGMRSVSLDLGDHNYDISDDDLKDLACAWPVLDCFGISSTVGSCVPRRKPLRCPTIRGLVELAQHCPRLTAISLPALDTKMLPAPESVPVLGRSRMERLTLSYISASGSNMHFNLAVLLDRLFPTLEKLDIGTSGSEGVAREVFRYLEVMQQGREHSQLFWQDCATDDDLEDEDLEDDSEDEDSEEDSKVEGNDHSEEGEED
ncbi:uncharacterized protein TRAVEDRAFT_24251 [Trametes versicolor FP-101664 SS1]|uniref:uncharacterized protein n=1 Tax=Trametes versicolor (strain FP-101664) TaxID=717944 RepID=UPI00046235C9|nr:uncharacterized protein TRAVEDRAFT_24251 [Trametes versicolor FP-101664 SS1]EIW52862.1 hypothetical protein TRAVEDRAFT_24251 [Trametes versicolor FP-101664 SS1]